MNYLVTGDRGFIGHHLFSKLKQSIDIQFAQSGFMDDSVFGLDKVLGLDILEDSTFDKLKQWTDFNGDIDVIYHLAGQTSVQESIKDPEQDAKDNILTMIRLIKMFPSAKIIYTQTSAILSEKGKLGQLIDFLKGKQEYPKSQYGMSKKFAGDYLKAFHKDWVICILPNVYGEGGKGVVDIFKSKDDVDIYGDGEQKRTFVHVDDICEALIKAKEWKQGEYFLGGAEPVSINELTYNKRVVHKEANGGEIRESIIPNTTPNWKPIIKVKEYLKCK